MNAERRDAVAKGVRRQMLERRLDAQTVAEAAKVPPPVLRRFLDGELGIPQMHFARINEWFLEASAARPCAEVTRRRPGVAGDYALKPAPEPAPLPGRRHLNLANLARENEALRRRLDALEGKLGYIEEKLGYIEEQLHAMGRGLAKRVPL